MKANLIPTMVMYIRLKPTKKNNSILVTALIIILLFLLSVLTSISICADDNPFGKARSINVHDEIKINDDLGSAIQAKPAISVYSNWIYTTWHDKRNGDFDIFFSRSSDGGLSWGDGVDTTDVKVNDDLSIANQLNPKIMVNSLGTLFIVWEDYRLGNWDAFLSYSEDNGDTWSENIPVNGTDTKPNDQRNPGICIDDDDNIYIVVESNEHGFWDLEISRSVNNGNDFSEPVNVTKNILGNNRQNVEICIGPKNQINLVWSEAIDNSNSNIYFSRLSGDWPDFIDPIRVDNGTENVLKINPVIDVYNTGDVFITWLENNNNLYNLMFDKLYLDENAFHKDIKVNKIDNSVHAETIPDLIVTNTGIIYISWVNINNNNHIFISESINGGQSFVDGTEVDTTGSDFASKLERLNPCIIDLDKNLLIVWEDYREDPLPPPTNDIPENGDIYFAIIDGSSNTPPSAINIDPYVISWSTIQLNWSICHEPDFDSYKVEMATSNDFSNENIIQTVQITKRITNTHQFIDLIPVTKYFFRITVKDTGGLTHTTVPISAVTMSNTPPDIEILEPDGKADFADKIFIIKWWDEDIDNNATITLYYYNDIVGEKLIGVVQQGEDGDDNLYYWNTSGLSNGNYFIKIIIRDTHNPQVVKISTYEVIVNHDLDKDPPEIINFYPYELENEVPLDTVITIFFNEDLNQSSTIDSITLSTPIDGAVSGSTSYDQLNQSIIFTPEEKLKINTEYTVKLDTGVMDLAGNSITSSLIWKFQTTPIDISFIYPRNGSTNVSLDSSITIIFSEIMNTTSVEQTIVITPDVKDLKFNWSLSGSSLTITHSGFKTSLKYTVSLGPHLESKYGQTLMKQVKIYFYTASMNIAPDLIDYGFFELEETYLFYVEYKDDNGDEAGQSQLQLYRDDEFYQTYLMDIITHNITERLMNIYSIEGHSMDGNFSNGEIFYCEMKLTSGEYSFYFEFEDVNDEKAVSDNVPTSPENREIGPNISHQPEDENEIYLIITALLIVVIIIFLLLYLLLSKWSSK